MAFTPPPSRHGPAWRRIADTSAVPPADVVTGADAEPVAGPVEVAAHGLVVLLDAPDVLQE